MCVVSHQGCCVFIQYSLVKGCCEWILIQPWTEVIDYSLLRLTRYTRLKIGMSHLSISGTVVHGRCYISHSFYFLLFFYFFTVCWLIFVSCFCFHVFQTVVWAVKNPYQTVYFFSDWSLNFIIFVMLLLHHIIVYYITKLHYSRLLYLIL